MDQYRIDSHKLIYHVDRVNDWNNDKIISPIYVEIAPSGGCNHRCIFCALDYMGYKPKFLDTDVLKTTITDAGKFGVKSIMFAGEGEPLLHKDIKEIINHTKSSGIDVSITTNGVFLTEEVVENCLKNLSWVRISLNAGSSKNYEKVHRCRKGDFERVISNLEKAARFKKAHNIGCTIGAQMLLIPENTHEVIKLAKILKKIKLDYFTVKPFSKHPMSYCDIDKDFDYTKLLPIEKKLQEIADKDFKVIFRSHTMRKLKEDRGYKHCLGLAFWAYIDAEGNAYACSAYLGDKRFLYGNIFKTKFPVIMKSKRRREILAMAAKKLDTEHCREVCRLDEINRYLWELKNPSPHVNFI